MKRRSVLAAIAVAVLAIGGVFVVLFGGSGDVERRASRAVRESASRTGVATDLAGTADARGARVASIEETPSTTALTAPADGSTPRPPGILVTIGGEPAPGVAVELSRDGEMHAFVTDASGFVAIDPTPLADRWWYIDCGWRGHIPVQQYSFDPDEPYEQVELHLAQLLHVEVVRSDGRAFGGAPTGVWPMNEWSEGNSKFGDWFGTHYRLRSRVGRQDMRCLELAGYGRATLNPGFTWIGPWASGSPPAEFSGVFGESDTDRVAWSGTAAPVAEGGGFTRIDLEVRDARDLGVLAFEITEPYAGFLRDLGQFTARLRRGQDYVAQLVVLEAGWRYRGVEEPRTKFELEPGTFDVEIEVDFGWEQYGDDFADVVVRPGESTRLEIAFPGLGAFDVVGLPAREWTERFAIIRIDGDELPEEERRKLHPDGARAGCLRPGRYVAFTEQSDYVPRGLLAPRPMNFADVAHHPWFAGEDVSAPWERSQLDVDADGDGENDRAPEDPLLARIAFDLEAGEIETLHFVPWPPREEQ